VSREQYRITLGRRGHLSGRSWMTFLRDPDERPGHPANGGEEKRFKMTVRIDTPVEVDYYRHGGILQMVLRQLAG